jgi:hypothetical protein
MDPRLVRPAVVALFLATGCVVAEPAVHPHPPPAPPAPVEVVPVAPGPAYVWIPGHWAWRGRHAGYVWVAGRYTVTQPGHVWVPGHWAPRPGGHVWVPGHWRRP